MRRGEINLNELLTLDELAEILSSVDPDVLREIANLVRHNRMLRTLQRRVNKSSALTVDMLEY